MAEPAEAQSSGSIVDLAGPAVRFEAVDENGGNDGRFTRRIVARILLDGKNRGRILEERSIRSPNNVVYHAVIGRHESLKYSNLEGVYDWVEVMGPRVFGPSALQRAWHRILRLFGFQVPAEAQDWPEAKQSRKTNRQEQAALDQPLAELLESADPVEKLCEYLRSHDARNTRTRLVAMIRGSSDQHCAAAVARFDELRCAEQKRLWAERQAQRLEPLRVEFQKFQQENELSRASSKMGSRMPRQQMPGLGDFSMLDLRSAREVMLERLAAEGRSCGKTFDDVLSDLFFISRNDEFTILPTNPLHGSERYDDRGRHRKAREIGELFYSAGGMELLQFAHARLKCAGGDGRDLERCWDGIGDWRG